MDAMTKRRVAQVVTGGVVAVMAFVAMWATGVAVLAVPGFMALGAMFIAPRLREGDAVLVMTGGEWAPGWVVAPLDDGAAVVRFDGSWGVGQGLFAGKDIELV